MKQSLLKIQLPPGAPPLRSGQFRELLAKGGDGSRLLPPEFFHYGPDGRPLSSGEPEIRVVGAATWVGLLGMKENSEMFDAAVGIAARIAGKHYGRALPINVEIIEFGLSATEYPVTYYLRDMAIKRRGQAARTQPIEKLTRDRLEQGLARSARRCGFDLPTSERLGITFHSLREIGMQLWTKDGPTKEFVGLVSAEFSMHLALDGMWQVGNLQARGHGRIIRKGSWNGAGATE